MYIQVRGIDFSSLSTMFLLDFGTVPEVPYFRFFIVFLICHLILVSLHGHVFMNALKVSIKSQNDGFVFIDICNITSTKHLTIKEERGLLLSNEFWCC